MESPQKLHRRKEKLRLFRRALIPQTKKELLFLDKKVNKNYLINIEILQGQI
jgi:hypothetical protein